MFKKAGLSRYSVDRISDLPPSITEHILQFVTLKDAVRTSILSTRWRFKWIHFPKLILDDPFFHSVIKNIDDDDGNESCECKFTNIVNKILFHHHGPIHKFVLSILWWFPVKEDISHWIRFLSTKSVHELTLVKKSISLKLPSWMFSCVGFANLTHLTLIRWIVPSLSTTCSGFPSLITLTYYNVQDANANALGTLVSKCPLLENLYLLINDKNGCLNITAPRLQNLVVEGSLNSVSLFKETERIKTLSLICELDHKWDQTRELFYCCPRIESLVLSTDCWQALDMSIVRDCCFDHLKSATICIRSSCNSVSYGIALEVIKKILSSSPDLELMSIVTTKLGEEGMNLALGLLRYRHTSSAEIIFNKYPIYTELPLPEPPQWSKYAHQHSYLVK